MHEDMSNKIGHQEEITFLQNLSFGGLLFFFFAVSTLWHYVLYGATFWFDFGKDDDYFFFSFDRTLGFQNHPQWLWWYQLGRYGSAEIWAYLSLLINDLNDLFKIRSISLLVSSIAMTLLALSFIRINSNRLFALFTAALLFSLPAISLNFTYILGFPSTIAWVFSLLAFLSSFILFGDRLGPSKFGYRETFGTILCVTFLSVSVVIYQMSMFLFLVPCTFFVLFGNRKNFETDISIVKNVWYLIFPMIITFGVAFSYYIFHKFVYLPRFFSSDVNTANVTDNAIDAAYKFTTSSDYLENIQFFFQNTLPKIFDLINLNGYPSLWILVAGLIVLSGLVSFAVYFRSKSFFSTATFDVMTSISLVALCAYFFLSAAPLVAQGTHGTYRVIWVMSAMIFLVFVWSGIRLMNNIGCKSFAPKLFISFCLLVAVLISTHNTVLGTMRAEAAEVEYVSSRVREFLQGGHSLHRIHFVQSEDIDRFTGKPCDTEFFCSSTRNGVHFMWAVKAAIEGEIGRQKNIVWGGWSTGEKRNGLSTGIPYRNYSSPVVVSYSTKHEALPTEEGTVIIDFSSRLEGVDQLALREASVREPLPDREIIQKVSVLNDQTQTEDVLKINYTRRNAFDGGLSGNRFWETGEGFPVEVTLDFVMPKSVKRYSFYSRDAEERMPKAWKLEALDSNVKGWQLESFVQNVDENWSQENPIYIESREFNLVEFDGHLYAIPSTSRIDLQTLSLKPDLLDAENIFVKKSVMGAERGTEMNETEQVGSADIETSDNALVNIVRFAGRLYAVPQSVGTITLEQWRDDEVAFLDGVFVKPARGYSHFEKWIEIDKRILDKSWKKNEKQSFFTRTSRAYKTFRWTFTEGFSPGVMRLYEITINEQHD